MEQERKMVVLFCFAIWMPRLSMQQCLEIWLTVLSGLSCKLEVLSSTSTSTDMKPRSKVEPGRDEQRFPANQNDWNSGYPPACQMGNVLVPSLKKKEKKKIKRTKLLRSSLPFILQTPVDKMILAGGGFSAANQIESPNPNTDTSHLEASHEEANTKVFLWWITKHPALLLFHCNSQGTDVAVYIVTIWKKWKSGWKDNMSLFTPLGIIQTQKGIIFRNWGMDFIPALGVIWPPWQGILLECFSAVLGSAEITEKRWSSWDAKLFICEIQCAKVRHCQHGPVSHESQSP